MRGRRTTQRPHLQDRTNEDGLCSLHHRVVTHHSKEVKRQGVPDPQTLSNLDLRADAIETDAHDRIRWQRTYGNTTHPRKIIMRYNYVSKPALTLFPGMPGSIIEQPRGRIAQIEIDTGLGVRGGVMRL